MVILDKEQTHPQKSYARDKKGCRRHRALLRPDHLLCHQNNAGSNASYDAQAAGEIYS